MNDTPIFLAVDLGASSGRVLAVEIDAQGIQLHEIHRFPNYGLQMGPHLMWNLPGLWHEILHGLQLAAKSFNPTRIRSVGVDTWGVDFALISPAQELVGLPYHYRDSQSEATFANAFSVMSREAIYQHTGLQFIQINSLYPLLAIQQRDPTRLTQAARFLMMPDVFHWLLSGQISNEQTDVSTSQIYNPQTQDWAWPVIDAFGLPRHLFGPISCPGTSLGPLQASVRKETGLPETVQVVLPGSHDTASAVVAIPGQFALPSDEPDWCFISSGTWSLMGVERARPLINSDSAALNFTNEAGVAGTTRVLKNIAGLWLIQECRRIWQRQGRDYSWEEMQAMATSVAANQFLLDPDDPRLIAPSDMPQTLCDLAQERGPAPSNDAEILRCAFDSLAMRYAQVLSMLERLLGRKIERIFVIGGGVQNRLLCQLTADACQRPVVAGSSEATALGNALVQAIHATPNPSRTRSDGQESPSLENITQARSLLSQRMPPQTYTPTR